MRFQLALVERRKRVKKCLGENRRSVCVLVREWEDTCDEAW